MEEFDIVKSIFDIVFEAASEEYEKLSIRYYIAHRPDNTGKLIDVPTLRFYSLNADGKKSGFKNRKPSFATNINSLFEELRDVMSDKSENGKTWEEAILNYEHGGKVKMDYTYPKQV